ncbi:MAG: hypothetical protein IPO37_18360 [Saprospiraceae bacterium]|nr:hypothetical protein [Saprospiraceae bacterium]
MKIHHTLSLFLTTITSKPNPSPLGPPPHYSIWMERTGLCLQPMIPAASSDGKHVDFYGLTGSKIQLVKLSIV